MIILSCLLYTAETSKTFTLVTGDLYKGVPLYKGRKKHRRIILDEKNAKNANKILKSHCGKRFSVVCFLASGGYIKVHLCIAVIFLPKKIAHDYRGDC